MIIGVCGFYSTGSSAVLALLKEFDDANVIENEFIAPYYPDGIEDLEYRMKDCSRHFTSPVAIYRFRKFMKWQRYEKEKRILVERATEKFLSEIVQFSISALIGRIDRYLFSTVSLAFRRIILASARIVNWSLYSKICYSLLKTKVEISMMPEKFDAASKAFVSELIMALGESSYDKTTIINQPFESFNPVKSFKYFDKPKAIVVDRDPRDHYLFIKSFLEKRGRANSIPIETVDDYIAWYKLARKTPHNINLRSRDDVLVISYESLVYDYEATVDTIVRFSNVKNHYNKGKYFSHDFALYNTQIFKKITEFSDDIKRIESELSEYLFPFDDYPYVEHKGKGLYIGKLPPQVKRK